MKSLIMVLVMASPFVVAQNNIALMHTSAKKAAVAGEAGPEMTIAPFELINGLVVVQAMVNGEPGSFILDTGAPALVIDKNEGQEEQVMAMGVGGQMSIRKTALREFNFGNIRRENLTSYVLDISQLEQTCGRDLMGLIGYDLLQQYELQFDYANKTIKIYPAAQSALYHASQPLHVIPFSLRGHIPVIAVRIGGKKAFFGLDSGAAANLLDESYLDKLEDSLISGISEEWLVGLDNSKQTVVGADVRSCNIGKSSLPSMRYLFTGMSQIERQLGSRLDGLLGFPFFKNQKIAINYKMKKIYLW